MKPQLTKPQINQLYAFIQKKGVKYLDVQIEIVDHIATKIEENLVIENEDSADTAIADSLKKLKKRDFKPIVSEKEKQAKRLYRRLWWMAFKAFFRLPNLFFTCALTGVLYGLFYVKGVAFFIYDYSLFVLLGAVLYSGFLFYRKIKMRYTLSFNRFFSSGVALIACCYSVPRIAIKYCLFDGAFYPLIASFLITLWILIVWSGIQASEELYKYSRRTYPQAFA